METLLHDQSFPLQTLLLHKNEVRNHEYQHQHQADGTEEPRSDHCVAAI